MLIAIGQHLLKKALARVAPISRHQDLGVVREHASVQCLIIVHILRCSIILLLALHNQQRAPILRIRSQGLELLVNRQSILI